MAESDFLLSVGRCSLVWPVWNKPNWEIIYIIQVEDHLMSDTLYLYAIIEFSVILQKAFRIG